MTNDQRFLLFIRQLKENWTILVTVCGVAVALGVGAVKAQSAIADQGERLTAVEGKVGIQGDKLSAIDERTKLTLSAVERIDAKVDDLRRRRD